MDTPSQPEHKKTDSESSDKLQDVSQQTSETVERDRPDTPAPNLDTSKTVSQAKPGEEVCGAKPGETVPPSNSGEGASEAKPFESFWSVKPNGTTLPVKSGESHEFSSGSDLGISTKKEVVFKRRLSLGSAGTGKQLDFIFISFIFDLFSPVHSWEGTKSNLLNGTPHANHDSSLDEDYDAEFDRGKVKSFVLFPPKLITLSLFQVKKVKVNKPSQEFGNARSKNFDELQDELKHKPKDYKKNTSETPRPVFRSFNGDHSSRRDHSRREDREDRSQYRTDGFVQYDRGNMRSDRDNGYDERPSSSRRHSYSSSSRQSNGWNNHHRLRDEDAFSRSKRNKSDGRDRRRHRDHHRARDSSRRNDNDRDGSRRRRHRGDRY